MTEEQILQAFNGRWRIKSTDFMSLDTTLFHRIKELCLDFFRTGILLAEGPSVSGLPADTLQFLVSPPPGKTLFDVWWNLYDKKIDRAKCERKFNKLTHAEQQACIVATPAYVASTPDLQFRRHPMTYLNNKSWENQIIPRNNATSQSPASHQQEQLSKLKNILAD